MKSDSAGSLIVFEGIDGTGKSTQIQLLSQALESLGAKVVTSQEPTTGPFGQKLRKSMSEGRLSPDEELNLFHEDRRLHVKELIEPELKKGSIVILDRYYFSTMAYQGTRGYDPLELRETNEAFAPVPDVLVIMELDLDSALQRIGGRDGKANTFEKRESLESCAQIFETLHDEFIHRVDASLSKEKIHQNILQHILKKIPL